MVQGPEAGAVWARATDVRRRYSWEGGALYTARDGECWLLYVGSGTMGDFLDADEDEHVLRRLQKVTRFAREQDLLAAVTDWERVRTEQMGHPPSPFRAKFSGAPQGLPRAGISLRLRSPMSGRASEVVIARGDGPRVTCGVRIIQGQFDEEPGHEVGCSFGLARGELERLQRELALLNAGSWKQYAPTATDGLHWELTTVRPLGRTVSSGINAYPPDGAGEPGATHHVDRLLLAVQRAAGLNVWTTDLAVALGSISDPDARRQHAILAALRAWAHDRRGEDPAGLREKHLQEDLPGLLTALTGEHAAQRHLAVAGAPVLERWPAVGAVDIEIADQTDGPGDWLELKWVKKATEMANCAWDAAKLAEALRAGVARRVYLVAGAPVSAWKRDLPARRLFDSSVFAGRDLLDAFPTWWPHWLKEGGGRGIDSIPTPIMTTPVGRARLRGPDNTSWLVCVSEIHAPGSDRTPVP